MHLSENSGYPQPHKNKTFNNDKNHFCSLMFKSAVGVVKEDPQVDNLS